MCRSHYSGAIPYPVTPTVAPPRGENRQNPPSASNRACPHSWTGVRTLQRVQTALHTPAGSDATEGVQEIERRLVPRSSQHSDAILLDRDLWNRIRGVSTDDPQEAWPPERHRLDFIKDPRP